MIKYGVNIDLVKKLIEKMIFSKTDLFTGVDIDLDDSGRKIFIYATFYIDNSKLGKYEDKFNEDLIKDYGSIDNVPDNDYSHFDDYLTTEILYVPLHRILFRGMGLSKDKYTLSVESVE